MDFVIFFIIGYVLFYWVFKESSLFNIFLGNLGKNLDSRINVDSKN